jgi:hypothetical protein
MLGTAAHELVCESPKGPAGLTLKAPTARLLYLVARWACDGAHSGTPASVAHSLVGVTVDKTKATTTMLATTRWLDGIGVAVIAAGAVAAVVGGLFWVAGLGTGLLSFGALLVLLGWCCRAVGGWVHRVRASSGFATAAEAELVRQRRGPDGKKINRPGRSWGEID